MCPWRENKKSKNAKIVAVTDVYDAMTSTCSYRPAMSKKDALIKIKEQGGAQFNPEVVKAQSY